MKKQIQLLALVFISVAVNAGVLKDETTLGNFDRQAHFYIVSCGVDDYRPLYGNVKFNSSVNDVKVLADSLTQKFCKMTGAGPDRVHVYSLLDEKATRKGITDVLHNITKQMKSEDVLFFSFSGDMRDFVPNTKKPVDYPYLLTYSTDSMAINDKAKFEKEFLSLKELRTYLELMPCKYQMLLLDAGIDQKEIGWKFASTMLKDIPKEQNLSQRKRVLIAPEGTSLEFVTPAGYKMGLLSYSLATYSNALNLFFDTDRVKKYLNEHTQKLRTWIGAGYCAVYSEDEILGYLQKFCECKSGGTRGATGTNDFTDMANTPVKASKKDLAVIVATDQYESANWDKLKTPLKDAESMEKLLREKYGFETRMYLNYSKDSLIAELKKLARDPADEEQQLFIFFAGHGYYSQDNLDGCLVMRDSKDLKDDPNLQSYFQFSYLSNFANNLPYKHVFVMLDICFGGSFGGNNNKVTIKPQGIPSDITAQEFRNRKKDLKGRLYLASGEKEVNDVSKSNPNHSPFADKIIDKLSNASATVKPQDLYLYCEQNINQPIFRKLADHNDESEFFFTPVGSSK